MTIFNIKVVNFENVVELTPARSIFIFLIKTRSMQKKNPESEMKYKENHFSLFIHTFKLLIKDKKSKKCYKFTMQIVKINKRQSFVLVFFMSVSQTESNFI